MNMKHRPKRAFLPKSSKTLWPRGVISISLVDEGLLVVAINLCPMFRCKSAKNNIHCGQLVLNKDILIVHRGGPSLFL
jgi:hypothetical protein